MFRLTELLGSLIDHAQGLALASGNELGFHEVHFHTDAHVALDMAHDLSFNFALFLHYCQCCSQ